MFELPNGDLIRPNYLRMVEAVEASSGVLGNRPPRVIVHLGNGGDRRAYPCKTFEAAQEMRDEIKRSIAREQLPAPEAQS